MGESEEDLFPTDPVVGEVDRFGWPGVGLSRCELAEGTARPGGVVVLQVCSQHSSQVVLIDDQQLVEDLTAKGADDPFADGVRPRTLGRDPQFLAVGAGEDRVERAGELARAVPDQELD